VTLFSQSYDNSGNLFGSQNDTVSGYGNFVTTYDDFTLATGATLTGITFDGGYYNGTPGGVTAFAVAIYADDSGAPGTALATGTFSGSAGETAIDGSVNAYAISFNPTSFAAGTYWLSVVPDLGFPPQWGWATSSQGTNNGYQCFFGTCDSVDFNFAFSVEGSVPEPSSWALMIAGFGMTGFALRRRQATVTA
jgi:hypothetical protein